MGIRDKEIERLIFYAKGLGVKVTIYSKGSKGSKGNQAEWLLDGSEIRIFSSQNKSKTNMVLDLIHEIGHQIDFIHNQNRQMDLKFAKALDLMDSKTDVNSNKHEMARKMLYETELAGTEWWEVIYKDTDIKISKWKLHRSMELDTWVYKFYYENAKFPTRKQTRLKRKELNEKYRSKNYDL